MQSKNHRLSARDLAFGIGRPATADELNDLMATPFGKGKTSQQLLNDVKSGLQGRRNNRLKD